MTASQQNTGKILTWGAVLLGGYWLVKKVVNPNITVPLAAKRYVERMRIGKVYAVKFKNDQVQFKFPIENPNNAPMVIDAIVGEVYVSDRQGKALKLGTIAHYGHNVIRPLGSTDFDLVFKIKLVNEFIYLSKVMNGKWSGQILTFTGTVNANGRPWPIKETAVIA